MLYNIKDKKRLKRSILFTSLNFRVEYVSISAFYGGFSGIDIWESCSNWRRVVGIWLKWGHVAPMRMQFATRESAAESILCLHQRHASDELLLTGGLLTLHVLWSPGALWQPCWACLQLLCRPGSCRLTFLPTSQDRHHDVMALLTFPCLLSGVFPVKSTCIEPYLNPSWLLLPWRSGQQSEAVKSNTQNKMASIILMSVVFIKACCADYLNSSVNIYSLLSWLYSEDFNYLKIW